MMNAFIANTIGNDFDIANHTRLQATGLLYAEYSLQEFVNDCANVISNTTDKKDNWDVELVAYDGDGSDCETKQTLFVPSNIFINYYGVIFA